MESHFISELHWNSHQRPETKWQRRMGVEPTRDRAERPLSRFEDGETHRGPYTSIFVWRILPCMLLLVKPVFAHAPHLPPSALSPSVPPCVNQAGRDYPQQRYSACQPHGPPPPQLPHPR